MNIFSLKKWSAREHNHLLGESTKKRTAWLSLDEDLSANSILDILLNTCGLPDPLYHPVNLFLHYTRNNESLRDEVLYRLGISDFKGSRQELLSLLYMMCASDIWSVQLAREICNVTRKRAIKSFLDHSDYEDDNDTWLYPVAIIAYVTGHYPYIEVGSFDYYDNMKLKNKNRFLCRLRKRMNRILQYKASEIVVLTDYYCSNYDPITKRRKLNLIHPYNAVLYAAFFPVTGKVDKTEKLILGWLNDKKFKMGMLPSNAMQEADYIWDALNSGRYHVVANKTKNDEDTVENSTDRELVDYLLSLDPELHIVFKTRNDLIDLVESTLSNYRRRS